MTSTDPVAIAQARIAAADLAARAGVAPERRDGLLDVLDVPSAIRDDGSVDLGGLGQRLSAALEALPGLRTAAGAPAAGAGAGAAGAAPAAGSSSTPPAPPAPPSSSELAEQVRAAVATMAAVLGQRTAAASAPSTGGAA